MVGRPPIRVWVVMLSNLAVTIFLSGSMGAVIVFYLLCASLLVGDNKHYNAIAALFGAMIPTYVTGLLAGFQISTTYGIVESIAYLQILVIFHGIGGSRVRGDSFGWRYVRGLSFVHSSLARWLSAFGYSPNSSEKAHEEVR